VPSELKLNRIAAGQPLDSRAVQLADALERAERDGRPMAPLSDQVAGLDLETAYSVQRLVMSRRIGGGARPVGHKVGLTSVAMQEQLNVSQPDYGQLLDDMAIDSGTRIDRSPLIKPRVEPEIAFVLGAPLAGPGVTTDAVLGATTAVAPALEVIDSRIVDWRITLVDTVADNASSARFVLGERVSPVGLDLASIRTSLYRDDDEVGSGLGSAVLGHPAAAVAWLANTLAGFGESLAAGEIVLPGAMCASVPLDAGHRFRAVFDDIGEVSVEVYGS
jgi:2-oxopent-4-enoate hydratase